MPGESQETPSSPPDPTVMTTEQLDRAIDSLRDWMLGQISVFETRLDGMDKATELLSDTINRTPTEITKQIAHLKELMMEKFGSVDKQFESSSTALAAAFAAQEKQAQAESASTAEARKKSEETTDKGLAALSNSQGDLKDRLVRVETSNLTRQEAKQETGASWGIVFGAVGALVAIMSLIAVVAFAMAK